MEQQFIAVSEMAPRLGGLTAGQAKKFLREYSSYANRVENPGNVVSMRRLVESDDLDSLLLAAEGVVKYSNPGDKPTKVGLDADLDAERESEDSEDEEESHSSRSEHVSIPGRLTNEHITCMIVQLLGPQTVADAGNCFGSLTMKKEEKPFSALSQATQYLRDWKTTEEWCNRQLPKEKFLIKKFIWGVVPRKFASALEMEGFKKLSTLKEKYFAEFRKNLLARQTLVNSGGLEEKEHTYRETAAADRPKFAASAGANKGTNIAVAKKDYGSSPNTRDIKQTGGEKTCYNCGKVGHIRPNCPLLTPTTVAAKPKTAGYAKLGSMRVPEQKPKTPILVILC